jgi:uncharacterized protein YjbJ (UPF0337 family)
MNKDRIEGSWKQFKGGMQKLWGEINNDQFDVIAGGRTYRDGKMQKSYGVNRDEAARQLEALLSSHKLLP